MRDNKNTKTKSPHKTAIRILKWVLAIVVVLIVLAFLLVPVFVSSEKGREIILAKINTLLDGQTNFANLSMGWFKGIKVTDFSFNDNLEQTFVQIKQIATKPHYSSILMGNLSFGQTLIDEPKIQINLKEQQAKRPVRVQKPQPVPVKSRSIALVMDVTVKNGNLKVTDSKANTVELSQINSMLNIRPPGQQTNFNIDLAVADEGKGANISVSGRLSPATKTGWSLKGTTGDLIVEVNDLDLGTLGPIFELAKIEFQADGVISANINSKIREGQLENVTARIEAKNLNISGPQLKGDRLETSVLDVDVKLSRKKQAINIDRLQVHSDWIDADVSGTIPTSFESFTNFLQPDLRHSLKGSFSCNLATLLSQMPRTFGLKEGMIVTSGKLTGNVDTFTEAAKVTMAGQANLAGLAGTMDRKKLALSEPVIAKFKITGQKDKISFDRLDVSSAFAKINATGDIEQIKYDGQADLAKLQSELGQFMDIGPYQMAGQLTSKGQVSIKEDRITAVGSSIVKELRLSSAEGITASEPTAEVAFTFDFDKKSDFVTVNSLQANTSLGQVSIKDAVLPLSKKVTQPVELLVSAKKIDLEKLQPFLVLFASFPKEMQLAGTAESQISVTSKKDTYRIVTDRTKIKSFKILSPSKEPFQQDEILVILDAEIKPEQKAINVKKLELESPQIKIKKGEFKKTNQGGKTKLQGQAELEYDWSVLSSFVSQFLPKGMAIEGRRKDIIEFTSEYLTGQPDGLMANLNSKAELGFEKAQYLGLNFGATEVDIQFQNGLLNIAPFSTTVNNGQFKFAGQADFKQKPAILKTPGSIEIAKGIQINDEMGRKLLTYLSPIFADASKLTGIVNFSCEKLTIPLTADAKDEIELAGTISISNLRFQASDLLGQILSVAGMGVPGQDFAIRPTRFILQDGFLKYKNMQVDVGDNPINFTNATIGLDKSYDTTIILPWTWSGRTARIDKDVSGERITFRLKTKAGEKPKLDLGSLLQEVPKQLLDDLLRKGLEEIFR